MLNRTEMTQQDNIVTNNLRVETARHDSLVIT